MYILHLPSWFPNEMMPYSGNFIEKHIAAISKFQKSITLKVIQTKAKRRHSMAVSTLSTKEQDADNHIMVEYFITTRTSLVGRLWMKICERYYYYKGMKHIEKLFGKPEMIHLHVALPLGNLAVKWSNQWKIPLLLTEHWSIYNSYNKSLITKSTQKKLKKIFITLSGITTVSENLLHAIQELFPVKKSAVIYNVVNTDLFIPQKENNFSKKILHVSTLHDHAKNISGILEGIKLLSTKRTDFILEVIGEFKNYHAERYVRDNALEKFVHFLGSMPEEQVARKMGECDFFLLFSNYENLPCVILEALSCGKPVITTPVGGISEIVNEKTGIFVEPQNVIQLVEKIEFMLQHAEKFDSTLARNYAVANFSIEVIGRQFQNFYKEIIHLNHIN